MRIHFLPLLPVLFLPATLFAAHPIEAEPTRLPTVEVVGVRTETVAPSVTELYPTGPETNAQIREIENLNGRVPNLGINSNSQRSFNDIYTIRGLGNTTFFSDPAVALYVDEVAGGDTFSFFTPLYHIDHVDIFRGPQPARFGQNAEAGIISIHTRRADKQAWHGEATASFGSYDSQEYRVWLGGPLVKEKLTLDLSGFWGLSSGFIDNTYLGNRRDDRDALGGRAVLTWTPAPDWEIAAGFEWVRAQDGAQRLVPLSGDPFQVRSDVDGSLNLNQHREWLKIAKRFDTWQVKSITGHSEWEVDPAVLDIDFSPARADFAGIFPGILPFPFGGRTNIRREQEAWSQEIRFESLPPEPPVENLSKDKDGKTVADAKKAVAPPVQENHFRWNGGLFFQRRETSANDLRSFSAPFVTFDPFFFQPLTIYTPLAQRTVYSQDTENWAAYLNAGSTWGRLDIDAGLRVDYTRKEFRREKRDPISLPAPLRFSANYEEWSFAPTLGATFRVNENIELFARTTYGFKPGGFSAFTDTADLARYDRETVWATEAGVRARAWDNKVRAQLTGYYHHIDDYQVERTVTFADYLVLNAGEATSRGVELELSFAPLEGLTFTGAIGYNETELHEFKDPFTLQSLDGNEAPYVPNFTALAALEYRHSTGAQAKVEYVVTGATHFTDLNIQRYRQAPYGLLNARIGYENDHWGAYVFGRNLTDEEYFTNKTTDIDAGVIGEPRVIGVMGILKF